MKIFDFDEKFYDYVRTWIAIHPGLTEKQIEDSYNEMMLNWLNAPAKWLNGEKPGEYFQRYSDPKDLMKLLEEYDKRSIGLPEPLYSRIVSLGEICALPLLRIAENPDRPESIRASAIAMLRDIGSDAPQQLYVDLVCSGDEKNDLCDMAADILAEGDGAIVGTLLDRYESAPEAGQLRILEICTNFPGDDRIYEHLVHKLRNRPEQRAMYASFLGKLGDPRAIEELKSFLNLADISYFDYIELRSAIEELGGDAGEERAFYGDPDYEAMRGM